MNRRSPSRILGICLAGAAALVVAAPGGARVLPVDEGDGSMVARNGWGAAATLAKKETSASRAAKAEKAFLAQYGWGAAATYAKLHT